MNPELSYPPTSEQGVDLLNVHLERKLILFILVVVQEVVKEFFECFIYLRIHLG